MSAKDYVLRKKFGTRICEKVKGKVILGNKKK